MAPRRIRQRATRSNGWRFNQWGAAVLAVAACLGACGSASAQAVVQPLPGGASQSLNAALARLGRDPRDLAALIDAGNAALQMGDVDAATGFFARADQLSPNNMRVKAGLAAALVRSENPYDAIPLFAEAEKAGAVDPALASDRGLAYDLVGDNQTAQRYYRQALASGSSDETLRRLALSEAIAGDRAGMELTLSPLLQRQDKGAWRTRAFALAILGRPEEAVAIASQTMPADLANGIAPYLRYMPKLTAAQQAAAANFGRFPRAADIGRDDPRVALYAPPRRVAAADAGLVPAGEPLGNRPRSRSRQPEAKPPVLPPATPVVARSAPPEPMPARQVTPPPPLAVAPQPERRPVVTPAPTPAAPPPVAVAAAAAASAPRPAPVAAPVSTAAAPALTSASGFNLARVASSQAQPAIPAPVPPIAAAAAPAPAPVTRIAPPPAPVPVSAPAPRPRRVADAFSDFSAPSGSVAPAPGAVDVRKIAAAKPKPVEPPKPVHPSRIWVQVGTGRDTRALGFTWRGLVKDNAEVFRGKSAWISDWGRTNRLLTGPFPTEAAAEAFLARLKKKDLDAFLWTSPAGQVVDDLPGK